MRGLLRLLCLLLLLLIHLSRHGHWRRLGSRWGTTRSVVSLWRWRTLWHNLLLLLLGCRCLWSLLLLLDICRTHGIRLLLNYGGIFTGHCAVAHILVVVDPANSWSTPSSSPAGAI